MGNYGGLEAFVLAVAQGVHDGRQMEMEVEVVFKQAEAFRLGKDLEQKIRESGLEVRFCKRASSTLWQAIRRADVVHLQNPCPDVVAMSLLARKPLLINVINHLGSGRGLHVGLWRWGLRLARERFYISEFVRNTWEKSEVPWGGSRVVFPICQLSSLPPLPIGQRRGFVFVARWIENKGLETLIEAYARAGLHPEKWPLKLLGDGPLRSRVQNRVRELGLEGIEMPGFVSEEEKGRHIRGSRFAVIPPNTREDFGLVAIEARHLGVPCIITRDGGVPEAAGKHSLSCEPGDVDALAALLQQAAGMAEDEYASLAASAHHSLAAQLVKPGFYADAYQSLAKGNRSSGEAACRVGLQNAKT